MYTCTTFLSNMPVVGNSENAWDHHFLWPKCEINCHIPNPNTQ